MGKILDLFDRIFRNWRTTVGALIVVALFFWAYYEGLLPQDGLKEQASKLIAGAVTVLLLTAKDPKSKTPRK